MSDLNAKRGPADATVCSAAEDSQRPDDERHRSADTETMACHGACTNRVIQGCMDFEECKKCGTSVRWDLVEHPFFGFANSCPDRP
jgi:hypothetical protein